MAGKVGLVQSVGDGYGFTLHDNAFKTKGSCLMLCYATQEEAEFARELVLKAFDTARSATAPQSR